MNKDTIYINSVGGLGNRLKNIVSGMILSDQQNKLLKVYWILNSHFGCNFNDIFKYPKLDLLKDPVEVFDIPRNRDWQLIINNENISIYNIQDNNKIIASEYFSKFILHDEVRQLLDYYMEKFDIINKYTIGVHFRYDNEWITCRQMTNNQEFIDLFISKMSTYTEKNSQFFISCANTETTKLFLKHHSIIYAPKTIETNLTYRNLNRNKQAMVEAVIDMYILSKCREIIITPLSTFSECAWYLGKCSPRLYNPISKTYIN